LPGLAECVANGGDHRREAASGASRCFALQRHGPFRGLRASLAGIAGSRVAVLGTLSAIAATLTRQALRRLAACDGASEAGASSSSKPEQGAAARSGAYAQRSAGATSTAA